MYYSRFPRVLLLRNRYGDVWMQRLSLSRLYRSANNSITLLSDHQTSASYYYTTGFSYDFRSKADIGHSLYTCRRCVRCATLQSNLHAFRAIVSCPYRFPRCQLCDGACIALPGHVKRACSSFVGSTRLASQGYP